MDKRYYGFVYMTTNAINGKKYIGQRKYHHDNPLSDEQYMGSGKLISYALKKYGAQNFSKVHLEECLTLDDLNVAEQKWIDEFDALNNKDFYNIAAGGSFGDTWSGQPYRKKKKFRQRIAESNHNRKLPVGFNCGEKNGAFGRHWYKDMKKRKTYFLLPDDPLIQKLSLVPGTFRSKRHNQKIGAAHRGKKKNYVVAAAGKKTMNDGSKNFYVDPKDMQDMLDKGYKLGQIKHTKGKIRMNNGHENVYVSKKDVKRHIKHGYVNGWLPAKDLLED